MYQPWVPPPPGPPPWGRPAGPSVAWAVLLWCVATMSLVGTLLFGAFAAVGFWYDNQLDSHGVTTTATVTDVDELLGQLTIEFTTDESERVVTEFTWWPTEYPAVGEQIEITYDAENPYDVIQAGSNEDRIIAVVLVGAALAALGVAVGAGVGAVLVHRARGNAARSYY